MLEIKVQEGIGFGAISIKINALGLVGSLREDSEDHYVYFGSSKDMNGKVVNDVICSKEDQFAE